MGEGKRGPEGKGEGGDLREPMVRIGHVGLIEEDKTGLGITEQNGRVRC